MELNEVKAKMKEIFKTHSIDVTKVTDGTNMSEDLNIDSLDLVEIVMEIEETFTITITESEMANLKTFGDLANYVHKECNK